MFSALAWQKGYLLQPIHHYRPTNGWDTERTARDLDQLKNRDNFKHFDHKPQPADKL